MKKINRQECNRRLKQINLLVANMIAEPVHINENEVDDLQYFVTSLKKMAK